MEAHFPGSSKVERKFKINLIELEPGQTTQVGVAGPVVTPRVVMHPSGTPSLALRTECDGKVVAYTGDTEWVDALVEVGRGADLLIAEAYTFDRKVRFHLDYAILREKAPLIGAKRLVLTHMSPEMLARVGDLTGCEAAEDGMELILAPAATSGSSPTANSSRISIASPATKP